MSLAKPLYTPPPKDKTNVHVSIDIETLGLTPGSVVLSVGLVAFTLQGAEVGSLFFLPSVDEQKHYGRHIDPGTAKWWNEPAQAQAKQQFDGPQVGVGEANGMVKAFMERFNTPVSALDSVWGFGADFDNAILGDLLTVHTNRRLPWHYRKNRCGRTLTGMYPDVAKPASQGQHHHALDDARWQAEWFRRCLIEHNARQTRTY